ncbi:helix-turn-helix domain-containing protein [Uliginosibacterium sp. H3]|uniref:Helix-turn-helix domain-containing protein n=1 Tax=Uliginosibacterium silvisoli TaxID=3114758 RepID=A0ABU6K426_9RHOO|nr:helix-turn-helix domain-containing protein [Uliginosibacterium sp. H3]
MNKSPRKHFDPVAAQARRDQVLDAAAECFRQKGFHGASMAEISKSAGMSAGHIYNYFESKEEIIFGIVDRHTEDVLAILRAIVSDGRDVLESILDDVPESVRTNTDLPHVALMAEVSAEAARNPAVASKLHAAEEMLSKRLDEMLMSSEQALAYRQDPQRLGRLHMLIALFEGLRQRALHCGDLDRAALVAPLRRAILAVING